jgi:hypothetical protein
MTILQKQETVKALVVDSILDSILRSFYYYYLLLDNTKLKTQEGYKVAQR